MTSYEYGFITIKNKTVMILGLGYVGLTLGLVMADSGYAVKGFDVNKGLMAKLKRKEPPFYENGLQDLLDDHIDKRFKLVDSPEGNAAEVFIITVGTPIDKETKEPKMDMIRGAAKTVGKMLSKDNIVILRSTVMIGTTRNVVIPELEKASGMKAGKDFFVAFCFERTAEGRALKELRVLPQIIGGYDEKSCEIASRLFNEYTPTIIKVDSVETAELCKLMDNCYRDVRFAFANQLATLAEKIGLNIHKAIDAVNLNYQRNSIPKPSPGVGGPCLTKDPYILNKVFRLCGMDADLLLSARKINETSVKVIPSRCDKILRGSGKTLKGARVFVVGFAFKGEPETSDLRDSTTLWFLESLRKYTKDISGYDPVVTSAEIKNLGIKAVGIEDGFRNADAVFIMNNHRSYLHWNIEKLVVKMNKPAIFFDSWYVFAERNMAQYKDIIYTSIGIG
ncbi:MAG: hypothetical protein A2X48_18300 [Lentisphaerae bacterium GWF2_49_21]|nr:MAG: hypothetical protein A2X48_18300 [Lentisphaerae bacterium GWF2_49_21]